MTAKKAAFTPICIPNTSPGRKEGRKESGAVAGQSATVHWRPKWEGEREREGGRGVQIAASKGN